MSKRKAAVGGTALILAMLLAGTAAAQDCIDYRDYLHARGSVSCDAQDVAVAGDYAYVTDGVGLQVIDITDPDDPQIAGSVAAPGGAGVIAVLGDFAYTASSIFHVIDITNPVDLPVVGSVELSGEAGDVFVSGNHAYLTGDWGLLVIDFTDPTDPQIIGSEEFSDEVRDVAVSGDYAYVTGDGFHVIDIANPASPHVVGSVDTPNPPFPGDAYGVAVSGNYAYVTTAYCFGGEFGVVCRGGLHVIDISNPANPQIVGSLDTDSGAFCVTVSGEFAFIGVKTAEFDSRLMVVDIANPDSLQIVGTVIPRFLVSEIAVLGDFAYTASSIFHVIDITNPESPPLVGSVDTFDHATDVAVSGDYACVVDEDGLCVIDITNPANPFLVGSVDPPGRHAGGVAMSGDYAYVAAVTGGLQVIDITNPADPQIVGSADTPGDAWCVTVSGDYAYVACRSSGLQVIDISNPASPQIVGSEGINVERWRPEIVAVSGNYAYVTGDDFKVIDIADPANPHVVGSVDDPWGYCVAVSGDYAYVGGCCAGVPTLTVVNIADPTSPSIVGAMEGFPVLVACSIAVVGDYAYVADTELCYGAGSEGLRVIDITDPTSPEIVGNVDTPGQAMGVAISGDYAYILDMESGLHIAPAQCDEIVAVEDDPQEPAEEIPDAVVRLAVHPNPFNPQTTVTFSLPRAGWADVGVYDLTGRRMTSLASGAYEAGQHTLTWTGRDLGGRAVPSGTYIVRLETEERVESRKAMLVR